MPFCLIAISFFFVSSYKYFSTIKSNMYIKMINIQQSTIFVIQKGSVALQMNSVRYVYGGFGYLDTPYALWCILFIRGKQFTS